MKVLTLAKILVRESGLGGTTFIWTPLAMVLHRKLWACMNHCELPRACQKQLRGYKMADLVQYLSTYSTDSCGT